MQFCQQGCKEELDCAGLQPGVRLVEEQAAQLAELHNNLMEQRSVKISNVNSSKWEEVRAFSMLEVRV